MQQHLKSGLEFIIIYVILRGIIARAIGDEIKKYIFEPTGRFLYRQFGIPAKYLIKAWLIKTEKDLAVWVQVVDKQVSKGR